MKKYEKSKFMQINKKILLKNYKTCVFIYYFYN